MLCGCSTPEFGSVFVARSPPVFDDSRCDAAFSSVRAISTMWLCSVSCGRAFELDVDLLPLVDVVDVALIDDEDRLELFAGRRSGRT